MNSLFLISFAINDLCDRLIVFLYSVIFVLSRKFPWCHREIGNVRVRCCDIPTTKVHVVQMYLILFDGIDMTFKPHTRKHIRNHISIFNHGNNRTCGCLSAFHVINVSRTAAPFSVSIIQFRLSIVHIRAQEGICIPYLPAYLHPVSASRNGTPGKTAFEPCKSSWWPLRSATSGSCEP